MPNAAAADLAHDLEDLHLAATRVRRHVEKLRGELVTLVDADARVILLTYLAASEALDEHRSHFPDFTSSPEEARRTEGALLIARADANDRLLVLARALRETAQMALTPKPASVRAAAVQPESRL